MIHIIYIDNHGIKKKKIFEADQIEFMKFWFKNLKNWSKTRSIRRLPWPSSRNFWMP